MKSLEEIISSRERGQQPRVSANYFAIQARLRGRWFSDADASRNLMWPSSIAPRQSIFFEDSLGQIIRFDASQPPIEIVGILDDLKEGSLDSEVQPAIYTPFDQGPDFTFYVVARTAQSPQEILTSLEQTVHHIDPEVLALNAETMEDRIHHLQSTYLHRSSAWLVAGFAVMALFLSVVGLYGVIAYSVSLRTREIGVRMALGAERSSVYRLILAEAGRLIATGIGVGLLCAIGAAALMSKLLFGTQPWDGATLAGVALLLAATTASAAFIPAHRAAAVEPVEALRTE